MQQSVGLAHIKNDDSETQRISVNEEAAFQPVWPEYFARLGQNDATTWHYKGYRSDTLRVWRAYYGYVLSHPLKAAIGARQFYQSLMYRVFGAALGDRASLIVTLLTPALVLSSPVLSLAAVAVAKIPRLHRLTPPLFQQFTLVGWSNYCCMLALVFSWHGYKQFKEKLHPLQCMAQSAKSFWNDFFAENLPPGCRSTHILCRSKDGELIGSIPKQHIIAKPEFGGAGYKLRSFLWDPEKGVFHCNDIERSPHEPETLTPYELQLYITGQKSDFILEALETPRSPLPRSTLRILTTNFAGQSTLLSAAFLVAPPGSVSTAYFDIDGYLLDFELRQTGQAFRHGSEARYTGLPIPELDMVIAACLEMHNRLACHLEISWDVILTDEGPVFLEGNIFPPGCDYKLSIFKNDQNLEFIRDSLQ